MCRCSQRHGVYRDTDHAGGDFLQCDPVCPGEHEESGGLKSCGISEQTDCGGASAAVPGGGVSGCRGGHRSLLLPVPGGKRHDDLPDGDSLQGAFSAHVLCHYPLRHGRGRGPCGMAVRGKNPEDRSHHRPAPGRPDPQFQAQPCAAGADGSAFAAGAGPEDLCFRDETECHGLHHDAGALIGLGVLGADGGKCDCGHGSFYQSDCGGDGGFLYQCQGRSGGGASGEGGSGGGYHEALSVQFRGGAPCGRGRADRHHGGGFLPGEQPGCLLSGTLSQVRQ